MDTGSVALDLLRKRKPSAEEIGAVSLLHCKNFVFAWLYSTREKLISARFLAASSTLLVTVHVSSGRKKVRLTDLPIQVQSSDTDSIFRHRFHLPIVSIKKLVDVKFRLLYRPIISVRFKFRFFHRRIFFFSLKFRFLYRAIVSVWCMFPFFIRPILVFGFKFQFFLIDQFNFSSLLPPLTYNEYI